MSGLFLDIGGTHFRWYLEDGQNSKSGSDKTDCEFLGKIESLVDEFRPKRLGASFAGQVRDGKIMSAPNICTMAIDFESYFKNKYSIECRIDNDLKCAILAESSIRPDVKSMALLYVGTGFGSAFLDRGELVRGGANLAGEIGHIPFRKSDLHCGCGKSDCLELFCSGSALVRRMASLGIENPQLLQMRDSNDTKVLEIYDDFIAGLHHAVSTTISLLNPSVLVFGGGLVKNNPWLLEMLNTNKLEKFFVPSAKETIFELSQFDDGSMEGAKRLFG